MILRDRLFNEKIVLSKKEYVDLVITKIGKQKNALVLNDTFVIFKKSHRVFPSDHKHYYKNYYRYIELVNEPYHLYKEIGNDTLTVIKKKDTLFYKLVRF